MKYITSSKKIHLRLNAQKQECLEDTLLPQSNQVTFAGSKLLWMLPDWKQTVYHNTGRVPPFSYNVAQQNEFKAPGVCFKPHRSNSEPGSLTAHMGDSDDWTHQGLLSSKGAQNCSVVFWPNPERALQPLTTLQTQEGTAGGTTILWDGGFGLSSAQQSNMSARAASPSSCQKTRPVLGTWCSVKPIMYTYRNECETQRMAMVLIPNQLKPHAANSKLW